jgi:hypothetical protein
LIFVQVSAFPVNRQWCYAAGLIELRAQKAAFRIAQSIKALKYSVGWMIGRFEVNSPDQMIARSAAVETLVAIKMRFTLHTAPQLSTSSNSLLHKPNGKMNPTEKTNIEDTSTVINRFHLWADMIFVRDSQNPMHEKAIRSVTVDAIRIGTIVPRKIVPVVVAFGHGPERGHGDEFASRASCQKLDAGGPGRQGRRQFTLSGFD